MHVQYVPEVGDLVVSIFGDWPLGTVISAPMPSCDHDKVDAETVEVVWFFGQHQRVKRIFCMNLVLVLRPEERA